MAVLKDLIVHGSSRFINIIQYNGAQGSIVAADKGVFKKLIATDAEITSLDVTNLTAQNATVVGLLDVQGELHTNNWTNSNIATIEGNFYITPTVKVNGSNAKITIIKPGSYTNAAGTTVTTTKYQIVITGSVASVTVPDGNGGVTNWPANSKVLLTGSITKNNMTYPLGTLQGLLRVNMSTTTIDIVEVNSEVLDVIMAEANNSISQWGCDVTVSAYNLAPLSGTAANNYRPIGILLTARGTSLNSTYMDIYGGNNTVSSGNFSQLVNNGSGWVVETTNFGMALPNVRIGNLEGLPPVRYLKTNDTVAQEGVSYYSLDDGTYNLVTGLTPGTSNVADYYEPLQIPSGWGIYTDNGYFKGEVVANSGIIGGALIQDGVLQIANANISNLNVESIIATSHIATTDNLDSAINGITNNGKLVWNDGKLTISAEPYSVEISGTGIHFKYYTTSAASIDQDKLKIAKTVVLDEMQIGENNWTWKIDPEDKTIYLKWIGME